MVQCFVPECRHQSESHTCSYYRFPAANKDNTLRQIWIDLIRRWDKQPSSASRVCSCHFKDGKRTNLPEIFEEREKAKVITPELLSKRKKRTCPEKQQGTKQACSDPTCAPNKQSRYSDGRVSFSRADFYSSNYNFHTEWKRNQTVREAACPEPTGDLVMSAESHEIEVKSEPPEEQELRDSESLQKFQRTATKQIDRNIIMRLDPDDGNIMMEPQAPAEETDDSCVTKSEDLDEDTDDAIETEEQPSAFSYTEISCSRHEVNNDPAVKPVMMVKASDMIAFQNEAVEMALDLSKPRVTCTPEHQPKQTKPAAPFTIEKNTLSPNNFSSKFLAQSTATSDKVSKASYRKEAARRKKVCSIEKKSKKSHSNITGSQFRCFPCGTDYPDFMKLREHFLQKHMFSNPITHKCELCGKLFKSARDLSDHRILDHLYKCDVCGMEFLKEVNLRYHKEAGHRVKSKSYVCEICNTDFETYMRLYNHLSEHDEMKKFLCDVCGKGFAYQGQLTAHLSCHSVTKRFQCEACGKVFKKLHNLQKHQQSHSGMIKPFMCEICGKKLATKESYKAHVLLHKGPPSFQCDLCDKKYYSSFNLRNHKKDKHKNVEVSQSVDDRHKTCGDISLTSNKHRNCEEIQWLCGKQKTSENIQPAVDKHETSHDIQFSCDKQNMSKNIQSAGDKHKTSDHFQSPGDKHETSKNVQSACGKKNTGEHIQSAGDMHETSKNVQSACGKQNTEHIQPAGDMHETSKNVQSACGKQNTEHIQPAGDKLKTSEDIQSASGKHKTIEDIQTVSDKHKTVEDIQSTIDKHKTVEDIQLTIDKDKNVEDIKNASDKEKTSECNETISDRHITREPIQSASDKHKRAENIQNHINDRNKIAEDIQSASDKHKTAEDIQSASDKHKTVEDIQIASDIHNI
ncbi:hypothetical protein RRG08_031917 [Elysia crispata]|uniref:Uncharacterized protein n=1 Tax=Elysia crispata TaxID=231223 RepID=A0AAE1AHE3_9GAST|nr:hypothetical protein RRG08_031917 [Elysia crispata]